MRTLFQIHPINLSVAVWVGFLALFGIATDDGVVIATYLDQSFFRRQNHHRRRSPRRDIGRRTAAGPAVFNDHRHHDSRARFPC